MHNTHLNRFTVALAAGVLVAATGGAVADRLLTDPTSGQRLLLRDDGTYTLLPPAGGTDSGEAGLRGAGPMAGARSAAAPIGATNGSRQSGAAAPTYSKLGLDEVARAAPGELVAVEGWIGNVGTGSRFLMFRDRTVSPPYVVVRMSRDAVPRQGESSMVSPGASRAWADDLNGRCQDACVARVEGAVLPAPPGGAPEIAAHHLDVSP